MKEYNIRQDLTSVRIDKALIEQLENYILFDVPSIIGIDKELILKNYSLEIVDSIGSGEFNRISEFPLSMFQNGTKKITLKCNFYSNPYFNLTISFGKSEYSSTINISLKGENPSELAKGIYNEILNRIEQHKTYNYILHNVYVQIIGGASVGVMIGGFLFFYIYPVRWVIYVYVILSLISIIAVKGASYKPYSEFSTSKQLQINKTFIFILGAIIIPLILFILAEILK